MHSFQHTQSHPHLFEITLTGSELLSITKQSLCIHHINTVFRALLGVNLPIKVPHSARQVDQTTCPVPAQPQLLHNFDLCGSMSLSILYSRYRRIMIVASSDMDLIGAMIVPSVDWRQERALVKHRLGEARHNSSVDQAIYSLNWTSSAMSKLVMEIPKKRKFPPSPPYWYHILTPLPHLPCKCPTNERFNYNAILVYTHLHLLFFISQLRRASHFCKICHYR